MTPLETLLQTEHLSITDLVSIDDLKDTDIDLILRTATLCRDLLEEGAFHKKNSLLKGTSIFNFFNENSTRTRSSFELAGKHLGSDVINISGSAASTKKGETLGDTARTLDALRADLIVIRDAASGVPHQIQNLVQAPLINAGDGWHEHPTQALLDLFTLRRRYGDKKLTVLIVGDIKHSRVFGSAVRLLTRLGHTVRVCGFKTLIPKGIEQWGVQVFHQLEQEALEGVDVIEALRLQTERAAGKDVPTGREYSKNFMINERRLALTGKDTSVMHPGPVIREFDVGTRVLESPASLIQEQVANGLPLRMALLLLLIYNPTKKPNPWRS